MTVWARRLTGFALALIVVACSSTSQLTAVDLGRQLYREGLLPDGQPVRTVIAGDIRVDGTQFTCVSCHQRSGMGSGESWLIAPPIIPSVLGEARDSGPHPRPAYTAASLEHVLRTGEAPDGRQLEAPMPRVDLPREAADALLAYLATLSAEVSPGVLPDEIHLATVVSEDAKADAMLAVLETYVAEKNRNTRNETGRARRGPYFRANRDESYRRWVLHTWTLSGAPETWPAQLEAAYDNQPVFALLSGRVAGPWAPVQEFCEQHELPCLLPNTDLPPEEASLYTVYFSQGLRLEAATAASLLEQADLATTASVQVARTATEGGRAADLLSAQLEKRGLRAARTVWIERDEQDWPERVETALEEAGDCPTLVTWLGAKDLQRLDAALSGSTTSPPAEWLISSTLLEGQPAALFETALASTEPADRDAAPGTTPDTEAVSTSATPDSTPLNRARILHPFRVPADFTSAWRRVELWLSRSGIDVESAHARREAAQSWFACMLLGDALRHIHYDDFYRDFMLEGIDHMTVIEQFSATHRGMTFGPGQRYLSKGCYVLEVNDLDKRGRDLERRWMVP